MKKNNLSLLTILYSLLLTNTNHSFNVFYHGNDAETSFQTSWAKERFVYDDYIKYFPYYKHFQEQITMNYYRTITTHEIQQLPYPYNSLQEVLPFHGLGAYFNSEFIKKLFQNNTITKAIEIGSDFGLSTRHIASLLPTEGKLYAIDTWTHYGPRYAQFLSNIVRSELTHKIVPIQAFSIKAIPLVTQYAPSFDFIYVDGDHETIGVLSDLELYFPLRSAHGIICGDDWLLKTVRTAVILFAQKYKLSIYAACNFWFLKEEGAFKICSLFDAPEEAWIF